MGEGARHRPRGPVVAGPGNAEVAQLSYSGSQRASFTSPEVCRADARNHFRSWCRPRPAIRNRALQILAPSEKTVEAHIESFIKVKTGLVRADPCVLEAELA